MAGNEGRESSGQWRGLKLETLHFIVSALSLNSNGFFMFSSPFSVCICLTVWAVMRWNPLQTMSSLSTPTPQGIKLSLVHNGVMNVWARRAGQRKCTHYLCLICLMCPNFYIVSLSRSLQPQHWALMGTLMGNQHASAAWHRRKVMTHFDLLLQGGPLCFIHLHASIHVHYVLKAFQCMSPLSQEAQPEHQDADQKTMVMFERK